MFKHFLFSFPGSQFQRPLSQRSTASNYRVAGAMLLLLTVRAFAPAVAAPAPSIESLKARISREDQTATRAYRSIAHVFRAQIVGNVVRREAGAVLLWGRVYGDLPTGATPPREMVDESNILIVQPDPKGFSGYGDYSGYHYFLGRRNARSAVGNLVSVYVYGPPTRAYSEAKKRMEAARSRMESLRATVVKLFLTASRKRLGAHSGDRARALGEVRASLDLQRFLAQRALDAEALEEWAVEVQARVGIGEARAGRLSNAMEMLGSLMRYKATPVNDFPPVRPSSLATPTEMRFGAANDSPIFPTAPDYVFSTRPALYAALLGAWGTALPTFLTHADPSAKKAALQWSRVLVDNAALRPGDHIPDEAAPLEAAIARARMQELKSSGSQAAPFEWTEIDVEEKTPAGKTRPANLAGVWVVRGTPRASEPTLSPGERSPLIEAGDLLFSFNGQPVASVAELQQRLRLVRAGQWVLVGIYRDGKRFLLRTQMR